jgi:ABC-type dipeptide/oligopeptide/nickel transport system ATPase subunit
MTKPNPLQRFAEHAEKTARQERAIQKEVERSDEAAQGRKAKKSGSMQAGQRPYPASFPKQHLAKPGLETELEEEGPWDQTLSGGEKQRLAFARIMLHEPDIIVLDEATSALDPDSQDKLMKLLTDELKATTIVSVGHRPELEQFHDRKITLERRRGGAKLQD